MYQRRPSPRSFAPVISTPALLGQVLGITAVAFLITAVGSYLFRGLPSSYGIVGCIASFVLLFAVMATRNNPAVALVLFYGFAFAEGVFLAPLIAHYTQTDAGTTVVVQAAGTTGVGMLAIGAVAYAISVDYRKLSGIGLVALLALIVVSVVNVFFHVVHPTTIAWLTLGIFTIITLADFARIRAGGAGSTPVELALSIYLDALNIFLALLRIFGGGRSGD
jgi:modulator of FtsH protease